MTDVEDDLKSGKITCSVCDSKLEKQNKYSYSCRYSCRSCEQTNYSIFMNDSDVLHLLLTINLVNNKSVDCISMSHIRNTNKVKTTFYKKGKNVLDIKQDITNVPIKKILNIFYASTILA